MQGTVKNLYDASPPLISLLLTMGALLSIPFLAVPSITGVGGWVLSCCGAAAVFSHTMFVLLTQVSALRYADLVGHVHLASPPVLLMQSSSFSTLSFVSLAIWTDADLLDNVDTFRHQKIRAFDDGLYANHLSRRPMLRCPCSAQDKLGIRNPSSHP